MSPYGVVVTWRRDLGPLGVDQPVEPRDVALGRLGGVLHERPGIGVEPAPGAGRRPGLGQALGQLGPAALEQPQAGLGGQVAGEGQAQAEAAGVVVAPAPLSLSRSSANWRRPSSVIRYTLRARRPRPGLARRARRAARSPLREPVMGTGAAVASPGLLGGLHRTGTLEPGQGRVEGPERDVGEQPELVAQALADLVAVQLLVLEQARGWRARASGTARAVVRV